MDLLKKITCHCSLLSSSGSGTDDVQPSSASVKETSRILADEICCHAVLKDPSPPSVRRSGPNGLHARTMKAVVEELLARHRIVFDKSVQSIVENSDQHMDEGLERVATDMFKDGQVNWGRVVAVYAFAQRLSQYSVQHDMKNMTEKIADVTAKFVEDNLTEWILNQGGWDSFEKQFQPEISTESKVWTGLLCTFIGLGTLATITALK